MGTITIIEPSAPQQPTAISGPSGYLAKSNNLSDLSNAATARTNLGLSSSSSVDTTNADNITSGTLVAARLPAFAAGDVTSSAGSAVLSIANGHVTAAKMASGAAVGNLGFTPANKAGDTFTGGVTVPSLTATTAPSLSYSFSGQTVALAQKTDVTAASGSAAEIAGLYGITSGVGSGSAAIAYKMALGGYATANTGSGYVWGNNFVVNLNSGAGAIGGIVYESDLNVLNQAYSSTGGPYAANFYATGTSAAGKYGTAAFIAAYGGGTAPLWNYGMLLVDYTTANAFRTAAISDQSKSPIVLHATNTHTTGIDFSGATFTDAIKSPGFNVNGAGSLDATTINTPTGSQGYYLQAVHTLWDDGTFVNLSSHGNLNSALLLSKADTYISADTIHFRSGNGATNYGNFQSGLFNLASGIAISINGTQVVGARDTGWTAMTGTPDKATAYATSTVTLAQLAGRVAELQAILTAHGLIGA